jgi:predicted nucleic acid-binding protein
MIRVLLDTNIVLDVLLNRMPWQAEAERVLQEVQTGHVSCAVSSLTIANVFYIGRRQVGVVRARQIVRLCLAAFEILAINRQTLEEADRVSGPDFEDDIQIAAATIAKVDAILSRDPAGFGKSAIPVLSPHQFLATLDR